MLFKTLLFDRYLLILYFMSSSVVQAHVKTGRGRGRGRGRGLSSSRNTPPSRDITSSPPPPSQDTSPASRPSRNAPRPLPQSVIDHGHRYSIAQRVQCLTLIVEGFSGRDIEKKTGVKPTAQTYIKKRANARGFCPEQDPRILEYHVQDGARSGRPKEITLETEQRILNSVRKDRSGREKSSEVLAYEVGISRSSALRILHKYGLTNVKPTRKPGLNRVQKALRLAFCLKHQHWTLEDWKRVIWSDETSVILGQRRGLIRIWRNSGEAYENTCIRRR